MPHMHATMVPAQWQRRKHNLRSVSHCCTGEHRHTRAHSRFHSPVPIMGEPREFRGCCSQSACASSARTHARTARSGHSRLHARPMRRFLATCASSPAACSRHAHAHGWARASNTRMLRAAGLRRGASGRVAGALAHTEPCKALPAKSRADREVPASHDASCLSHYPGRWSQHVENPLQTVSTLESL